MVEISMYGSGEGLGKGTTRAYSTPSVFCHALGELSTCDAGEARAIRCCKNYSFCNTCLMRLSRQKPDLQDAPRCPESFSSKPIIFHKIIGFFPWPP